MPVASAVAETQPASATVAIPAPGLAAANYLCRASSAYDTEDGWRAGVRAFNAPEVYLGTVAKYARQYAEALG